MWHLYMQFGINTNATSSRQPVPFCILQIWTVILAIYCHEPLPLSVRVSIKLPLLVFSRYRIQFCSFPYIYFRKPHNQINMYLLYWVLGISWYKKWQIWHVYHLHFSSTENSVQGVSPFSYFLIGRNHYSNSMLEKQGLWLNLNQSLWQFDIFFLYSAQAQAVPIVNPVELVLVLAVKAGHALSIREAIRITVDDILKNNIITWYRSKEWLTRQSL